MGWQQQTREVRVTCGSESPGSLDPAGAWGLTVGGGGGASAGDPTGEARGRRTCPRVGGARARAGRWAPARTGPNDAFAQDGEAPAFSSGEEFEALCSARPAREPCSLLCLTVRPGPSPPPCGSWRGTPLLSPGPHSRGATISPWFQMTLLFSGHGGRGSVAPAAPSPGRSTHPRRLLSPHPGAPLPGGSELRSEIRNLQARKTVKEQNHQPETFMPEESRVIVGETGAEREGDGKGCVPGF